MNNSDIEPSAIIRPEKVKHISAAIGIAVIGLVSLIATITIANATPDFKLGIMPTILLVGTLLIPVIILIDMNLLRITAIENRIYVKNLNITKTFDFSVNEIKKITFRSQKYKSYVTYYTTIVTAYDTLEISNTQLGYKDMLVYLKDQYDRGHIPSGAISKFDYPHLLDNIAYYS